VVNLGDMIQRWTNDLYHSTLHRVLNTANRDRYSVATFFNPNYFYRVECLPTCRPEQGEPRYAPCTVGEHITEMFRRTYGAPKKPAEALAS
jgi:isopenicillin N synthase-like dioxygenase